MLVKQTICQTEDGELVEFGHPDSKIMLHGEGAEIGDERAKELGILGDPKWDANAVEVKVISKAPEDKQVKVKETK